MSLNTANLENIEFPNNIFEGMSLSPKYTGVGAINSNQVNKRNFQFY